MNFARLIAGFVAGALAVLLVHQTVIHFAFGGQAWSMRPIPPWGVPSVMSQAFWGGLWGVALATLSSRLRSDAAYWVLGWLFLAIGTTLVAWYVVGPIKGRPAALPTLDRWVSSLKINGAFAAGVVVFFWFLPRGRRG
jgi:hypothetical protein